ncbi:hypothetical protein TI04_01750 [Achromatium sp. WMS2]|nr:hypothetical protein TI04_01750 [Achromatium sp. WMS2]
MPEAILIVDDEQGVLDNLATYLEDEDLVVYTARSGEEAIRRIDAGLNVQICIVDLRLRGMSGIETIVKIRNLAPQTHFIIHTGSEDKSVATVLQRVGLDNLPVFRKPLTNMSALVSKLQAYYDHK